MFLLWFDFFKLILARCIIPIVWLLQPTFEGV
jgi:hypothetical protein